MPTALGFSRQFRRPSVRIRAKGTATRGDAEKLQGTPAGRCARCRNETHALTDGRLCGECYLGDPSVLGTDVDAG